MTFRNINRSAFAILSLIIVFSTILTACGVKASSAGGTGLAMISMEGMPADVKSAPVTVQQSYQFAAANPDIMKKIPCYCGCGAMGHTSNYSCYVSSVDTSGKIEFDPHALGCSICVDITQDTMRMLKQGKTVSEIKTTIDQTYAQYGPSNMP